MSQFVKITSIEDAILIGFQNFVRGKAEEIVARHLEEAKHEIDAGIRNELSRVVLNVSRMVSVDHRGEEIVFTISDRRESK